YCDNAENCREPVIPLVNCPGEPRGWRGGWKTNVLRGRALGLERIATDVSYDARGAKWRARLADVAAVQDQPMVCVVLVFGGNHFRQSVLDLPNGRSAGQAGAIGHAE